MGTYVQYGCGLCAPDGWLNFDTSPSLRIQKIPVLGSLTPVKFPANARYGDIRNGLPLPDGSADAVYCSHVLEHLALEDFRLALRNTLRVLRPGGVFRLVLPDLRALAKEYVESQDPTASMVFLERTLLGRPSRPKGLNGLLRSWIGNSEHLWMWDYNSLSTELTSAGFVNTRAAVYGDSGDEMFNKVEDAGRWREAALGMQTQKPQ